MSRGVTREEGTPARRYVGLVFRYAVWCLYTALIADGVSQRLLVRSDFNRACVADGGLRFRKRAALGTAL